MKLGKHRERKKDDLEREKLTRSRQIQIGIYNQRQISSMHATQSRIDHRNHQARRFLPDRVLTRQRLRGTWLDPTVLQLQHSAN
ncbi:hypothetical protein CFP56_042986 [Quercus suber]|uniref:Uncharacterized protein n=1 Tax=Quercus suber TaxID=58331 RepID=A0AAW0ISM7_QUESU